MAALRTEAFLTFPAPDAMREGCQVYAVVDAVGGTSFVAHGMALRRIEQAGAKMLGVTQFFGGSCFRHEGAAAVPCRRPL